LTTQRLPAAAAGTPYHATFAASGGASPYLWAITDGALPSGITLDPAAGALSGTPTMEEVATFTVRVTDGQGAAVSRKVSLVVTGPLLEIGVMDPAVSPTKRLHDVKVLLDADQRLSLAYVVDGALPWVRVRTDVPPLRQVFGGGRYWANDARLSVNPFQAGEAWLAWTDWQLHLERSSDGGLSWPRSGSLRDPLGTGPGVSHEPRVVCRAANDCLLVSSRQPNRTTMQLELGRWDGSHWCRMSVPEDLTPWTFAAAASSPEGYLVAGLQPDGELVDHQAPRTLFTVPVTVSGAGCEQVTFGERTVVGQAPLIIADTSGMGPQVDSGVLDVAYSPLAGAHLLLSHQDADGQELLCLRASTDRGATWSAPTCQAGFLGSLALDAATSQPYVFYYRPIEPPSYQGCYRTMPVAATDPAELSAESCLTPVVSANQTGPSYLSNAYEAGAASGGVLAMVYMDCATDACVGRYLVDRRGAADLAESPQPEAVDLAICAESAWTSEQPAPDAVVYACEQPCAGESWTSCVQQGETTDAWGRPLQRLAFVTDGMAGELRWNLPPPDLGIQAGLLVHRGLGGTGWPTLGGDSWHILEQDGVLMIGVKWQVGAAMPPSGMAAGWLSHTDAEASTFIERTRRPAAVIRWAHDHLVAPEVPFGTAGCSGGAVATFSSVFWHGLDALIDYQFLSGGPMVWDLEAACRGRKGVRNAQGGASGMCEQEPERACAWHTDCGSGGGRHCARPGSVFAKLGFVDYVLRTGTDCLLGRANPAFAATSYRYTDGDRQYDHPIDFTIAGGTPLVPGPQFIEALPTSGDTSAGITWQVGQLFRAVRSPATTWTDYDGAAHCAPLSEEAYMPAFRDAVLRGLGVAPQEEE
jgi:hypothetical protein